MVVEETALIIWPVVPMGLILGLYELILIHGDMNFRGSHWLGHGLHSVGTMMIALFIVFNVDYFLAITGIGNMAIPLISNPLVVRIAIGIILNIKIHAASSLAKGGQLAARGLAEHWTHTIVVSALVVAAPYMWPFLEPIVMPMMPSWLGGIA